MSDTQASHIMTPLLQSVIKRLAAADIELTITQKRIKNINFRLKPYTLAVSVPTAITAVQIAQFIDKRVSWAIANHQQVLERHHRKPRQQANFAPAKEPKSLLLWGERQSYTLNHEEKISLYRQQLSTVMPELLDKWQPKVRAVASEVRIKKMHTRWGSCNTRARRIWLSVYLPEYPIECTEYVIVHELCHLHHADHSAKFWQTVESAMPDYKIWHARLAR